MYDGNGTKYEEYAYDAWGKCSVIYDKDGIATKNPYRYRGYYLDKETDLYYLNSRYYDPEVGRFISADAISELDAEEVNGLNLYRYCANNPVMMNDTEGNAPAWWEWLVSGVLLVAGVVLCATGVGSVFGAGLISAGGSMMASNIMSAAGVDGKVASIISAGLNIAAGVVLCATGIGGALGASMIGSGVGSIGGGFLSEALGFGFEAGAMIGGVVGGIVGGQIYKGISTTKLYRAVSFDEANSIMDTGKFTLKAGAFEGKQFGLKLSETREFAKLMGEPMIAKVKIPKSLFKLLDKTSVDPMIFKSGTVTVNADVLNVFNKLIKNISFYRL